MRQKRHRNKSLKIVNFKDLRRVSSRICVENEYSDINELNIFGHINLVRSE